MQTLYVCERTGKGGIQNVRVPIGVPEKDYGVVVIVPLKDAARTSSSNEPGWPPGYFEDAFGSISDEAFVRPPQRSLCFQQNP